MTPRLVILYGIGGLSDVGRHAVRAALDAGVSHIKVLTQHPELLELPYWKCSCPEPHTFTDEERQRFQVVKVDTWPNNTTARTRKMLPGRPWRLILPTPRPSFCVWGIDNRACLNPNSNKDGSHEMAMPLS